MNTQLNTTLQTRKILHKILKNTPQENLFKIPDGFRNSIWWNIAHVLVTQQLLVYKLSNLPLNVSQELVDTYKKGSFPNGTVSATTIEKVSELLFSTLEHTIEDFEKGLFTTYNEYPTSAGIILKNIDDAIAFNLFHEGIHLGVILSLQKAIG